MACHSYWNSIVLKPLFRLTLQSIALDYFELSLHYCHMTDNGNNLPFISEVT